MTQTEQLRVMLAGLTGPCAAEYPQATLVRHMLRLSERLDLVMDDLQEVNDDDDPLNGSISIMCDSNESREGILGQYGETQKEAERAEGQTSGQ